MNEYDSEATAAKRKLSTTANRRSSRQIALDKPSPVTTWRPLPPELAAKDAKPAKAAKAAEKTAPEVPEAPAV